MIKLMQYRVLSALPDAVALSAIGYLLSPEFPDLGDLARAASDLTMLFALILPFSLRTHSPLHGRPPGELVATGAAVAVAAFVAYLFQPADSLLAVSCAGIVPLLVRIREHVPAPEERHAAAQRRF